jgi:NADP-dependent 3-hydroxy acid dehydrogenase YdfG
MLSGRTILITGASSGIGSAIATRFAMLGARLILLGRDEPKLRRRESRLKALAPVRSHVVDFSDEPALTATVARIDAGCDRLDALVHAAGIYSTAAFERAADATLAALFQVNVSAVFTVTRAFLPLLERAGGDIVVINSSIVARPARGVAHYAASKHALKGLTDALREEIKGSGIRVTSLYPGRTATPTQETVHAIEGKPYQPEKLLQPADVAELALFAIALPRTAELVDATIRPAIPPMVSENQAAA